MYLISRRITCYLMMVFIVIIINGCANRQTFEKAKIDPQTMENFLADKPDLLKPYYRDLKEEKDRNAILNHMKIGKKAFEIGEFECAKSSFNIVRNDISSIYANNETAKKARSLWYEEGIKRFRGEPYERAMAFYYSGLLFLKNGDYENARACFKSGIQQDAFAEEEQFRCDFALLIFLEAISSRAAGDRHFAKDVLNELKKVRPNFELDINKNSLVIVETGKSPRKLADGPGHSELKFRRGKKFYEKKVEIAINNNEFFPMFLMEDVYWQAASRGGRPIDKILEGQAIFRQTHSKVGSTLGDISSTAMIAAPLFDNSGAISSVSGAIGLIAVGNMAIAQNVRPHADTRYWDNLPDAVHIYMVDLPEGNNTLKFKFKDDQGRIIKDLKAIRSAQKVDSPLSVIWLSSRSL